MAQEHGKASTYTNYNCRCQLCRTAWAKYLSERRHSGYNDTGRKFMDVLIVVDDGNKKGDKHEFAVGFRVNPKALADAEADLDFIAKELLAETRETIVEHLSYLVKGQLSALDATRQ